VHVVDKGLCGVDLRSPPARHCDLLCLNTGRGGGRSGGGGGTSNHGEGLESGHHRAQELADWCRHTHLKLKDTIFACRLSRAGQSKEGISELVGAALERGAAHYEPDPALLSPQPLRMGEATAMIAAGRSEEEMDQRGGWIREDKGG
jgi:hypothetical protein